MTDFRSWSSRSRQTTRLRATDPRSTARRVADLFDAAVDQSPSRQRRLLDERCPSPSVRREVEDLLDFVDQTRGFLQRPAWAGLAFSAADEEPLAAGSKVGSYRLVKRLGAGGMGVVYLAERADRHFDQRVALKVIHGGLATDELRSLFRQERQILANLEHPGIARLIDGGELEDGRPYLVMEFVDGEPIDVHCQSLGLGLAHRLRLFIDVCGAVQASHRGLVIHQDLKPGNILVDSHGRARLVDFGTARPLPTETAPNGPKADRGPTFLTPAYCSPEQRAGGPVTTATDIYSLGLILERLAFGHGDSPTGRAAVDLRAVIVLATRHAPEDRYETVAALADDVERFLTRRPTTARPGPVVDRLILAFRRHPWSTLVGAMAVLMLVAFGWSLHREKETARLALDRSERAGELLVNLFAEVDPEKTGGQPMTAQHLLAQGERLLADADIEGPLRLQVVNGLAKRHFKLGQFQQADELLESVRRDADAYSGRDAAETTALRGRAALRTGRWPEAGRLLEASLHRLEGSEPGTLRLRTRALTDLMELRVREKDLAAADGLRRRLLPALEGQLMRKDPELGRLHSIFGCYYTDIGSFTAAEHHFSQAVELAEARAGGRRHPDVAEALGDLALVYKRTGRSVEALKVSREALDIQERLLGRDHPLVAAAYHNLGALSLGAGRLGEAIDLLRQAVARSDQLAAMDPTVPGRSRRFLATALTLSGSSKEARRWARSAMDFHRRSGRDDPREDIRSRITLAYALSMDPGDPGAWTQADELFADAIELCLRSPTLDYSCANGGGFYLQGLLVRGEVQAATDLWRRLKERVPEDGTPSAVLFSAAAGLHLALGDSDAAAARVSAVEAQQSDGHDLTLRSEWRTLSSLVHLAEGDLDSAELYARRAVAQSETRLGTDGAITARARLALARVALRTNRRAEAARLLEQAVKSLPPGADRSQDGGPSARTLLEHLKGS